MLCFFMFVYAYYLFGQAFPLFLIILFKSICLHSSLIPLTGPLFYPAPPGILSALSAGFTCSHLQ